MSTLVKLGRLGQVYIGWFAGDAHDGRAPLSCKKIGSARHLLCGPLHVIVER